MKSLINQLQEFSLSPYQSETALFVIEDWLQDFYPVLAQLYHVEILRKELMPRPTQVQLVSIKKEGCMLLTQEATKWKSALVETS